MIYLNLTQPATFSSRVISFSPNLMHCVLYVDDVRGGEVALHFHNTGELDALEKELQKIRNYLEMRKDR